jgi:DNA-binding NtrC family response regulator
MPHRKHILLVEDDADVRAQIGVLIEMLGYVVHLAGDVPEAKQQFAAQRIDLVLSDLWMPGGDGTQLLQQFKAARPDLPVIILTGAPSQDTIIKTLINEGFAYVTKPLQGDQLRVLLERALGGKQPTHTSQPTKS